MEYTTIFGSLDEYRKGTIEVIDDDPKHYAFSNVFEVAGMSAPYEKVAVGKNQQYVLEAIRAEGTSGWRTCDHDEAVLCMDGEVTVRLVKLATPLAPAGKDGRSPSTASPSARRWATCASAAATWRCCPGFGVPLRGRRRRCSSNRRASATTRSSAGPRSASHEARPAGRRACRKGGVRCQ